MFYLFFLEIYYLFQMYIESFDCEYLSEMVLKPFSSFSSSYFFFFFFFILPLDFSHFLPVLEGNCSLFFK